MLDRAPLLSNFRIFTADLVESMGHAVSKVYQNCTICAQLADYQYGFQKIGREESHTYLPAAADRLQLVKELVPDCNGDLQVKQCPECATYYLYRTEYEFLYGGSEDEQQLRRLTNEAAAGYLKPTAAESD